MTRTPGTAPRLRAFFAESVSSTTLRAAVEGYRVSLGALGFAIEPVETQIVPLLDEAWASAWQQSFPAREIGRRLGMRIEPTPLKWKGEVIGILDNPLLGSKD